jgi:hypothetical protein
MNTIDWRGQLRLVWVGYGVAFLVSAGLVLMRYLQYVLHPGDAATYGTMYAFGDLLLGALILGLFLIPTFFMALVTAKAEPASILYSKVVFALSLTAPLSLFLLVIPWVAQGWLVGVVCLYRLVAAPAALVTMGTSRVVARFPLPKKLTSYSFMVELGTLITSLVLMFLSAQASGG